MTHNRAWALLLVLLGAAAPYQVPLRAATCRAIAPPLLQRLGPEWQPLASYVQGCPVRGTNGTVALTVVVVRIDRMMDVHYFNTHTLEIPFPVLLDGSGRVVGGLPEGFPYDPPGKLRVTFTQWRGGWPARIEQYEAGVSALAPHALSPQVWVPGEGRYRQEP